MANNSIPVTAGGPPLGNVETKDSYLRIKQNIESLKTSFGELAAGVNNPKPITVDQLEQIKKSLQAGGASQLNVTALPGILLQPQLTNLPEVTKLPAIGSSTDGQAVLYLHTIWRFSGKRRAWEEVSIIAIEDTRAQMSNNNGPYNANNYGLGCFFDLVDWQVLYICQATVDANNNNIQAWRYASGIYFNSFGSRPANLNGNDSGLIFFATDWEVAWTWDGGAWNYRWGEYIATLGGIPNTLGTKDTGFLFGASDYYHSYRWTGNNWDFAPGDPGSAYIVGATAVPKGGLWQICDGSAATVALPNGTTTSITTPPLNNNVFIMGGGYTGNKSNATPATWANNAATDGANLTTANENVHTHPIQLVDFNVVQDPITFSPGNSNATLNYNVVNVSVVNPTTGPGDPHNHAVSPNPHSHNLSNNNAVLNPPSEVNGGLPSRIALAWYMRR